MTELVFILDRSGSMSGLERDTIGGFNSMIEKQKKEAGEAVVSTVLFDNESVVIHDRLPLSKVPHMTEEEYWEQEILEGDLDVWSEEEMIEEDMEVTEGAYGYIEEEMMEEEWIPVENFAE